MVKNPEIFSLKSHKTKETIKSFKLRLEIGNIQGFFKQSAKHFPNPSFLSMSCSVYRCILNTKKLRVALIVDFLTENEQREVIGAHSLCPEAYLITKR